jgi:hypothetical protein
MAVSTRLTSALPALQPEDAGARLLLFGVRQMGANGLHDASAAHAFVIAFGRSFQRPLVLVRALVAEMSAASSGPIRIAPWCCPRMTGAEATLLEVVRRSRRCPVSAAVLFGDLLGVREATGITCTAQAVAEAFADLALPLD